MNCPQCDGQGMFLGKLGNRVHFRCRMCGWEFSEEDTGQFDDDDDDDDDDDYVT